MSQMLYTWQAYFMSARKQFLKIGIPKYVSIRKTEFLVISEEFLVISDQAVVKIAQQSFPLLICTWFLKNKFGNIKFDELDF